MQNEDFKKNKSQNLNLLKILTFFLHKKKRMAVFSLMPSSDALSLIVASQKRLGKIRTDQA